MIRRSQYYGRGPVVWTAAIVGSIIAIIFVVYLATYSRRECDRRGGDYRKVNCHEVTNYVLHCLVYGKSGCVAWASLPQTDTECDHVCVVPAERAP